MLIFTGYSALIVYINDWTATDLCERCEEDKATIFRVLDYFEKNDIRSSLPLHLTFTAGMETLIYAVWAYNPKRA